MKSTTMAVVLFIGMCWLFPTESYQSDKISPEASLKNADAIQAIAIANQWKWSKKNIKSFVTPREVVFKFSKDNTKRIPLPEDKMLVAVAPYVERTHRWTIHFMSSCQGELPGVPFYVKAVDQDGNVLVDETVTTLRNGFFELWLPRYRKIALRVQGLSRTAKGMIGTFDDSKTCVTTFRLR